MMKQRIPSAFFFALLLAPATAMIMRNNALMSKMVSKFQSKEKSNEKPTENSTESKMEKHSVVAMMQSVLCRNFPAIPCHMIIKDPTLRHLIEKSVQQMKYKQISLENHQTTQPPNLQLTLFPVINNEDLSNFLQVSDTGYFKRKPKEKHRKKSKKSVTAKSFWSHEAQPKKKEAKTSVFGSRKKIRKFYPHKVKSRDKNIKNDFGDYSEEKLSMSVELPAATAVRRHFSYKTEPSDPPVWRIDYMKHGEPSINMFGYDSDTLKGKIIKTGPNVIVDENVLEQTARKDVLHPDVYIKKNFVRKSIADNSEGSD